MVAELRFSAVAAIIEMHPYALGTRFEGRRTERSDSTPARRWKSTSGWQEREGFRCEVCNAQGLALYSPGPGRRPYCLILRVLQSKGLGRKAAALQGKVDLQKQGYMPPNEKATCASGAAPNEALIHGQRMQTALRRRGFWRATAILLISQAFCVIDRACRRFWGCIARSDVRLHWSYST